MKYYLSYDLQFFAKEGAGGEKTEDATAKKLNDAREEGQVARSQDLLVAAILMTLFLTLKVTVGYIGKTFLENYQLFYKMIPGIAGDTFTLNTSSSLMREALLRIIMVALPFFVGAVVVAFVVNVFQVKWKPTLKPLKPKFNKFNPIQGFKQMFSKDKAFEFLKAIVKIGLLGYIVYDALKDEWGMLLNLYSISFMDAIALIGTTIINLGVKISVFFLGFALIDYLYQKRKFKEDMKMTKQEVKDEFKQTEGDPQVKGKIKQKMREVSQRRMMQALPEADVVITNPTHLAVAIKYDKNKSSAPVVIAKGADYLAQKIKETAREYDIEIVENKPLARMLYYNVDLDAEIPQELYQMVAEILAYVYRLKGKLS
ncbi:flagellar biosynthesis protein FlhB [Acetivibrio ethanolgignens]|uniref:Flagellar biosynthetic protein FlhB n=1 Tax=Acetivibrio ethanolgignens TaxID=290052 RepID=A0A0V8QKD3_9FIRM|nr:flagellar biosynthesis protein FlhB [Acetivibrio ethanolgignens]KSV60694.1 flagellar biosynthetic protein FlhB [Acetivibrio ethanolgignens]